MSDKNNNDKKPETSDSDSINTPSSSNTPSTPSPSSPSSSLPPLPSLDEVKKYLPKDIQINFDAKSLGNDILEKSKKGLENLKEDPFVILKKLEIKKLNESVGKFNTTYLKPYYDPYLDKYSEKIAFHKEIVKEKLNSYLPTASSIVRSHPQEFFCAFLASHILTRKFVPGILRTPLLLINFTAPILIIKTLNDDEKK